MSEFESIEIATIVSSDREDSVYVIKRDENGRIVSVISEISEQELRRYESELIIKKITLLAKQSEWYKPGDKIEVIERDMKELE